MFEVLVCLMKGTSYLTYLIKSISASERFDAFAIFVMKISVIGEKFFEAFLIDFEAV